MAIHELPTACTTDKDAPATDPVAAAWVSRKAAASLLAALPVDASDCLAAPLLEKVDDAEEVMLKGSATTAAGIEGQLWAALCHSLLTEPRHVHDAAERGDIEALESVADLDWGNRLLLAAIRSVRASVASDAWIRARDAWLAAEATHAAWQASDDAPPALAKASGVTWHAMLETPAPDLAALRFKLAAMLEIEPAVDAMEGWSGAVVRPVLCDLVRLMPAEREVRPCDLEQLLPAEAGARESDVRDPISDYETVFAAYNAGKGTERAYLKAFRRMNDYQPATPRDFIRKFLAMWKEGGFPQPDRVADMLAIAARLVDVDGEGAADRLAAR